jgi:hypothetical protein
VVSAALGLSEGQRGTDKAAYELWIRRAPCGGLHDLWYMDTTFNCLPPPERGICVFERRFYQPVAVVTVCPALPCVSSLRSKTRGMAMRRLSTGKIPTNQPTNHAPRLTMAHNMQDIYGPRFHCVDCLGFDYCFMCMSLERKSHDGHRWKQIDS